MSTVSFCFILLPHYLLSFTSWPSTFSFPFPITVYVFSFLLLYDFLSFFSNFHNHREDTIIPIILVFQIGWKISVFYMNKKLKACFSMLKLKFLENSKPTYVTYKSSKFYKQYELTNYEKHWLLPLLNFCVYNLTFDIEN